MKNGLCDILIFLGIIIVILFAICLLPVVAIKSEDVESKIKSLKQRIEEVSKQIEVELYRLRIDVLVKQWLDRKADNYLKLVKILAMVVFSGVCVFFCQQGYGIAESVLMTSGIAGLLAFVIPVYFTNRVHDVNVMLEKFSLKIKTWIYKKHQFDPVKIELRQDGISAKNRELTLLNAELKSLEAPDIN